MGVTENVLIMLFFLGRPNNIFLPLLWLCHDFVKKLLALVPGNSHILQLSMKHLRQQTGEAGEWDREK